MEDVTELISKVSQELGPDASDGEVGEIKLEAVEALPESDRDRVLEQLVKGISSGQLRHLDKEVEADRQVDSGKGMPNTQTTPINRPAVAREAVIGTFRELSDRGPVASRLWRDMPGRTSRSSVDTMPISGSPGSPAPRHRSRATRPARRRS